MVISRSAPVGISPPGPSTIFERMAASSVRRAVAAASRPSYIIAWDGAGPTPLALALDQLGVRYQSAQFGRYWIITPLSRNVSPAEVIPALIQTYW